MGYIILARHNLKIKLDGALKNGISKTSYEAADFSRSLCSSHITFCAKCSNVYERLVRSQWNSLHCIHSKPHVQCNGIELGLDTLISARHSLV